jgi:hypothetical protein
MVKMVKQSELFIAFLRCYIAIVDISAEITDILFIYFPGFNILSWFFIDFYTVL